ncbi:MAG: hypothetical protein EBV32_00330 [Proteobacteria bacterium]|uniref:Phage major capsid protein n=1 Tax=Candidatus Fonsibacter lacus TaxID=2576439 RepID=A0A964UYS9_9PROT|nr:hypothetical protein [Candidatus Fonsibacter lacus]
MPENDTAAPVEQQSSSDTSALQAEIEALRRKNTELLDEKKKLAKRVPELPDGIDVQELLAFKQAHEQAELEQKGNYAEARQKLEAQFRERESSLQQRIEALEAENRELKVIGPAVAALADTVHDPDEVVKLKLKPDQIDREPDGTVVVVDGYQRVPIGDWAKTSLPQYRLKAPKPQGTGAPVGRSSGELPAGTKNPVPEVFTAYVDEAVTTRSAFINSGVIQPLAILNAQEGGDFINVPSWSANLSGDAEVLTDSTSLTPGKISGEKQICPVLHRGRAWEVRTLAALAAGDDPMAAIGRKVADYISHQQQKDIFSILKGVFGPLTSNTTGALKSLAIDSNASAVALNPGKVAEARAALGDQGEKLSVIAMHSKCYYDLVERKAIDYVTNDEARGGGTEATTGIAPVFGGSLAGAFTADGTVPFYMGMRVIVSDDVNNDGTNYASYLFTPGAMASGTQSGLVKNLGIVSIVSNPNF